MVIGPGLNLCFPIVWTEVLLYGITEWFMGKVWGFCKEVFYATFLDSVSKQGGCSSREDAYPWVDAHLWEDAHPRKDVQSWRMLIQGECSNKKDVRPWRMFTDDCSTRENAYS